MEEVPPDYEGGVSEVGEATALAESEDTYPMSQSNSVVLDTTSCKYTHICTCCFHYENFQISMQYHCYSGA